MNGTLIKLPSDSSDSSTHHSLLPNLAELLIEFITPPFIIVGSNLAFEKTFAIKGSTLNRTLLGEGITERFIIKISRSKETDGNNFALDFDPLNQNYANISFNKNLGNLNLKLNSNYSLFSKIPDYGANLEISGTF